MWDPVSTKAHSEEDVYILDISEAKRSSHVSVLYSDRHSFHLLKSESLKQVRRSKEFDGKITSLASCADHDMIAASFLDGTCMCFDPRSDLSTPIKTLKAASGLPLLATSLSHFGTFLAVGSEKAQARRTKRVRRDTEDHRASSSKAHDEDDNNDDPPTQLIIWDLRASMNPLLVCEESHNDDITGVAFRPHMDSSLFSASMDGLVCMFDITKNNEDDALENVFNIEAPAENFSFYGKNAEYLFSFSVGNDIYMWDLEKVELLASIKDFQHAVGNDKLSYAVGSVFCPDSDELFTLCGGLGGEVGLYPTSPSGFATPLSLRTVHSSSLRALAVCNESSNFYTGGEDGRLVFWRRTTL